MSPILCQALLTEECKGCASLENMVFPGKNRILWLSKGRDNGTRFRHMHALTP